MRNLGLIAALLVAFMPAPVQAQGDFLKDKVKTLIEKSGVYVSMSSRSSIDNDVNMGRTFGVGYGTAGSKRTGIKYPVSFSGYSGDLETTDGNPFGHFSAKQLMTGIGYQWVRGKLVYGGQVNVGYSFNKVTIEPGAPVVFGGAPPVAIDVSNSFVVRPQLKAEYFIHHKLSFRTQLSYTFTDPKVVVRTATGQFTDEWRPHHVQASVAMGVFPFRKK